MCTSLKVREREYKNPKEMRKKKIGKKMKEKTDEQQKRRRKRIESNRKR